MISATDKRILNKNHISEQYQKMAFLSKRRKREGGKEGRNLMN